jgi:predicted  nucleic acid-binding Zn-ribbon protein
MAKGADGNEVEDIEDIEEEDAEWISLKNRLENLEKSLLSATTLLEAISLKLLKEPEAVTGLEPEIKKEVAELKEKLSEGEAGQKKQETETPAEVKPEFTRPPAPVEQKAKRKRYW